ncbi:hypothetical protein CEXT_764601 [Caerostris extrusa]|uniref:Reverse transcriptase domain-containing protein n=1 Tax=Caerostris extrusa TaxID=172846 RepID=A0AAV4XYR5_CAEEX|nr:hypothetical protein CEXT_764601 [Caerostris extrusa]
MAVIQCRVFPVWVGRNHTFNAFLNPIVSAESHTGTVYKKCGLLQASLPQGAVLSCILLNAYINDLVQKLKSIHGVRSLLYADDLLIWSVTPQNNLVSLTEKLLNQALTSLEKWCISHPVEFEESQSALSKAGFLQEVLKLKGSYNLNSEFEKFANPRSPLDCRIFIVVKDLVPAVRKLDTSCEPAIGNKKTFLVVCANQMVKVRILQMEWEVINVLCFPTVSSTNSKSNYWPSRTRSAVLDSPTKMQSHAPETKTELKTGRFVIQFTCRETMVVIQCLFSCLGWKDPTFNAFINPRAIENCTTCPGWQKSRFTVRVRHGGKLN